MRQEKKERCHLLPFTMVMETFTGVTTKGVKIVKMSDKYWKDRYIGAKRIIK